VNDKIVCTAINRKYFPGLVALWHSIQANSPEVVFVVLAHGDEKLVQDIRDLGIKNVLLNTGLDNTNIPTSSEWPKKIPAMYSRLWMPEIFVDVERSVWLDADTIVLDSLIPLFKMNLGEYPIASTTSTDPQGNPRLVHTQVDGLSKQRGNFRGVTSGVIVFNHQWYKEKRILEQCRVIMNDCKLNLKFVVQSVLNMALRGDYYPLDECWQVMGNRKTMIDKLPTAKIVHYVGFLPWEEQTAPQRIRNTDIWREYAGRHSL